MSKTIEVLSKGVVYNVIVDEDFNQVGKIHKKDGYFTIRSNKNNVRLHRFVLGIYDSSIEVDHINGNKYDNRKSNLRISTRKQNCNNRIAKGYHFNKNNNKYQVQMYVEGKKKSFGYYSTPEEAQSVYRREHVKLHGEFSPYYKYDSGITKEEN